MNIKGWSYTKLDKPQETVYHAYQIHVVYTPMYGNMFENSGPHPPPLL